MYTVKKKKNERKKERKKERMKERKKETVPMMHIHTETFITLGTIF